MTSDLTILHVDLNSKSIERSTLPASLVRDYIGGRGLGAYLLREHVRSGIDPLSDDATTVRLPLASSLIGEVAIQPEVFTPNRDGINDEMAVEFTVLKLHQARPVQVSIYTISGRLVKQLQVREVNGRSGLSGRYQGLWDGRV